MADTSCSLIPCCSVAQLRLRMLPPNLGAVVEYLSDVPSVFDLAAVGIIGLSAFRRWGRRGVAKRFETYRTAQPSGSARPSRWFVSETRGA